LIFSKSSHADGQNIVPPEHLRDIEDCIRAIAAQVARGAATQIRTEFLAALATKGWSGEVSISPQESAVTITSRKRATGLCLQTGGNASRIYADLLKLQALYLNDDITCGIFVLPSTPAARVLGDNLAQSERLIRELSIFRKVITMPLMVCAFE
jgi:hypothetical protein